MTEKTFQEENRRMLEKRITLRKQSEPLHISHTIVEVLKGFEAAMVRRNREPVGGAV